MWIKEKKDENVGNNQEPHSSWTKVLLQEFSAALSSLSWDLDGHYLGVVSSEGIVSLFRETYDEKWELISESNNEGNMVNQESNS